MKVLKEGRLPGEAVCRGTCTHCGAEVEYRVKDARPVRGHPMDPPTYAVRCPTPGCGLEIYGSKVGR